MISQEDAIFSLWAIYMASQMVIVPNVNYHYLINENSALNKKEKKHHDKIKQQYKIGKRFRKKYACDNGVAVLWYFRKLINLFF